MVERDQSQLLFHFLSKLSFDDPAGGGGGCGCGGIIARGAHMYLHSVGDS
jgi:hypothetical protein